MEYSSTWKGTPNPLLSTLKNDKTYKKLEKERVEWLEKFCSTGPCRETSKNGVLKKALTTASASDNSGDEARKEDEEERLV